jgi:hypothetical protein
VWFSALLLANHRPGEWWDGRERVEIPAGSLVTSQPHLAEVAGVGRQVVRDALRNLDRIGSIRTKAATKRWTLIEVVNWPTYQNAEEQENQEENRTGTKDQPRTNHNGRMKEGEKEEKRTPPASGLTLSGYLSQLPPEGQELLRQTVQAVASTRKSGKVSASVLDTLASKFAQHPEAAVLAGCRIYLERDYASEGKAEAYLLGIVRGEAKRIHGGDRANGSRPTPTNGPVKTPGQLAIERVFAEQQAAHGMTDVQTELAESVEPIRAEEPAQAASRSWGRRR